MSDGVYPADKNILNQNQSKLVRFGEVLGLEEQTGLPAKPDKYQRDKTGRLS